MQNELRWGALIEIADVVMGQSPAGSACNQIGEGIPLLNGPTEFGGRYPSPTQYTTDPRKFAETGDLLFCVRGSTTGRMNWADQNYAIGRGLGAIRHKTDLSCQPFVRAVIEYSLPNLLAEATGSTFPNVSRDQILKLRTPIFSATDQKAIAHILGTLDDKIELNRQMNETLESMAQALFKSWYVDFDPVIDNALAAGNEIPEPLQQRAEMRKALGDQRKPLPPEIQSLFPDRFVFTEEMGWVPEEWCYKCADDVACVGIGKTPPRKESQWFSEEPNGNFTWVSIKDLGLKAAYINDSSEYLIPEAVERFNVRVVPTGSVLLSFKLTLGRVAIAKKQLTTNEAIAHFRDLKNGLNTEYMYLYLKLFDYNSLGSTSSIATAINSKIIKAMPVLCPKESVLDAFKELTIDWFNRLQLIQAEKDNLEHLRDTLLPKLLSGELRIPDAEKQVAEAL